MNIYVKSHSEIRKNHGFSTERNIDGVQKKWGRKTFLHF